MNLVALAADSVGEVCRRNPAPPAPAWSPVGSTAMATPVHAREDAPAASAEATPVGSEATGAVLAALAAAVRAVTLGASLERVLHDLAASARDLVGARYAAIGIPEPEGDEFARFVTVGMSDDLIARLGPLPRTHGLLDAMLADPSPYRTEDITQDRRFRGWWPSAHPTMRSFLGVPIVSAGDIIGAFYLTDKEGSTGFSAEDEAAVVLLASHAALAIDQARLFEDSRELALAQERGRLARELHDAMSQSLFSLQLAADTAAGLLEHDPLRAAEQLGIVRTLSGRVAGELRTMVDGLRPADLERDGLAATMCAHLALAGRAHGVPVELDVGELPALEPEVEHQVLRIAQEAVTNALRHADAGHVRVAVDVVGRDGPTGARGEGDDGEVRELREVRLRVSDDGRGFDPDARLVRARRLGLTSMHERAASVGGALTIDSAPGRGTTVELRFPT
jgi:signal transduction histidine kinase